MEAYLTILLKVQKFSDLLFQYFHRTLENFTHMPVKEFYYCRVTSEVNRKIKASQPTKVRYKSINKTKHLCNR